MEIIINAVDDSNVEIQTVFFVVTIDGEDYHDYRILTTKWNAEKYIHEHTTDIILHILKKVYPECDLRKFIQGKDFQEEIFSLWVKNGCKETRKELRPSGKKIQVKIGEEQIAILTPTGKQKITNGEPVFETKPVYEEQDEIIEVVEEVVVPKMGFRDTHPKNLKFRGKIAAAETLEEIKAILGDMI